MAQMLLARSPVAVGAGGLGSLAIRYLISAVTSPSPRPLEADSVWEPTDCTACAVGTCLSLSQQLEGFVVAHQLLVGLVLLCLVAGAALCIGAIAGYCVGAGSVFTIGSSRHGEPRSRGSARAVQHYSP